MENNIKEYREKELKSYIIANVLVVLIGTGLLDPILYNDISSELLDIIKTLLSATIVSSVIYVYVFIADAIVPSKMKDWIIWPFKGLPGRKVFSTIKKKAVDVRFTPDLAKSIYRNVYAKISNESEQKKLRQIENAEWYRIYKKHEKEAIVSVSQRDYLLCRDLNSSSLLLLIGFVTFEFLNSRAVVTWTFWWLLIEFIATWLISRSKGRRFCYNTIATDVAFEQNKGAEEKKESKS